MILSYDELVAFVEAGYLTGVQDEHINATSIDLCLGNVFLTERRAEGKRIDLAARESVPFIAAEYPDGEDFILEPGEFILACTSNAFFMPDDHSAEFSLKSSMARNGLGHLLAGWIDPGFNNSVLTLELHNTLRHHALVLRPGMRIGQIKVFRHEAVPAERSYRTVGRYNGDEYTMNIKP